ncbi:hypothetical protein Tco_1457252 [Tanacetum coccineum]
MVMNHLYQPWRAILSMTNQCLTGKTSGYDRPRYSVLQMLWGIITHINVDYAELIWEEFVQAIQIFLADKANLGIATKKDKKTKPYVIPYCQFTKLIICYLGRKHNINQRSGSPFNLAEDDHNLGNLKFVPKGEEDKVFGMQIPKELITDNIRNAPYYNTYLEMVAKHDHKIAAEEGGKKKSTSKTDQSKKPATAKQSKPVSSMGKVRKVRKGKSPLKLINEEEEVHHEPEPQDEGEEYDIERAIQMSLESFSAPVGGVAFREPAASATQAITTRPSAQPEDDTSANMVHESPSPADAETGADVELSVSEADTEILSVGEELQQGEEVSKTVTLEERIVDPDEGQARSEPSKLAESRPPPEHEVMKEDQAGSNPGLSHVALAGPDPEPMHDDFVATVYPQVHESLKHTTEEHVHLENPLSSSGTLSSMKNLDEMFGDQSFNDKPTEECGKGNVETEVESMVTVPIHQASSIAPPLSTPIINLSPPKPVATPVQEPIFTATTTTTTTSTTTKIFYLELRDLPHKINQTVNEVVKEAVQTALQAPLLDRFRDFSEADMKEILHQRMFESGSYKSHREHVALYKALEASMERANRDEFLAEKAKSRKRPRDDQDPPPPPPKDSDQSKKKRHDSDASGSEHPPAPQPSAWKTSDTREAPSSSSKQKSVPQSEQPVKDVPIPEDVHVSDSEDTGDAHLPKIKTRLAWLKLVPEEERPETPKPEWVIPLNDLPEPENNWVNAYANSYQDPEENKILQKTRDMGSFIKWYCRQIGKLKLRKADLEGPTYQIIDLVNPEGNRIVPDMGKPLPLGGNKERRSALSISKLKAAYYLDFGLEELVPSQWIESERESDISAAYGITHCVLSIKTYKRYGYTYLREIVLRRADYKEYKISEANFKNLHLNDFEDLYLLQLQGKLNHLSGADKVHLFNAVNPWIRNIVIRKRVEDLQLRIEKKMMMEYEVHKFSDGTLTRVLDKLDHMVKYFKLFQYNPGMEIRIWSEDDKRRSEEFMEVIERRLKIRRIFRSLESFVSGRLRDVDYRLITRTK